MDEFNQVTKQIAIFDGDHNSYVKQVERRNNEKKHLMSCVDSLILHVPDDLSRGLLKFKKTINLETSHFQNYEQYEELSQIENSEQYHDDIFKLMLLTIAAHVSLQLLIYFEFLRETFFLGLFFFD
jgi:hypothetical protein